MKVLVCGGREYNDRKRVYRLLSGIHAIHPFTQVIQGAAEGADRLAKDWALLNNVWCIEFVANWQALGNRAGAARNQRMLVQGKPDLVLAFPGGTGTLDMIIRSKGAGVRTFVIRESGGVVKFGVPESVSETPKFGVRE